MKDSRKAKKQSNSRKDTQIVERQSNSRKDSRKPKYNQIAK